MSTANDKSNESSEVTNNPLPSTFIEHGGFKNSEETDIQSTEPEDN